MSLSAYEWLFIFLLFLPWFHLSSHTMISNHFPMFVWEARNKALKSVRPVVLVHCWISINRSVPVKNRTKLSGFIWNTQAVSILLPLRDELLLMLIDWCFRSFYVAVRCLFCPYEANLPPDLYESSISSGLERDFEPWLGRLDLKLSSLNLVD